QHVINEQRLCVVSVQLTKSTLDDLTTSRVGRIFHSFWCRSRVVAQIILDAAGCPGQRTCMSHAAQPGWRGYDRPDAITVGDAGGRRVGRVTTPDAQVLPFRRL